MCVCTMIETMQPEMGPCLQLSFSSFYSSIFTILGIARNIHLANLIKIYQKD